MEFKIENYKLSYVNSNKTFQTIQIIRLLYYSNYSNTKSDIRFSANIEVPVVQRLVIH